MIESFSRRLAVGGRPPDDHRERSGRGFSLVEILVATFLISGLAASLLYSVALAVQLNSRSEKQWSSTLELWNRAVQARRFSVEGEEFKVLKDARPLTRVLICREEGSDPDQCWEVLRAEK